MKISGLIAVLDGLLFVWVSGIFDIDTTSYNTMWLSLWMRACIGIAAVYLFIIPVYGRETNKWTSFIQIQNYHHCMIITVLTDSSNQIKCFDKTWLTNKNKNSIYSPALQRHDTSRKILVNQKSEHTTCRAHITDSIVLSIVLVCIFQYNEQKL